MKKIVIIITPTGLIIKGNGYMLIAINPAGVISEKFFLKVFNGPACFCLN
jgi:hypothetical protein